MAGLPPPPKPARAKEDRSWIWLVVGVIAAALVLGSLSFAWLRRGGASNVYVTPAAPQVTPASFQTDVSVTPNSVKSESSPGFVGRKFICNVTIKNNGKSRIGLSPEFVGAQPADGPTTFGSITSYTQNADPKKTFLKPPVGYLAPGESTTADLVLYGAVDTRFVRWGYRLIR